jgi:HPt (histidine-containing phosphotransfer) domain-containing protein
MSGRIDVDAAIACFGGKRDLMLRAARAFVQAYAELPRECAGHAAAGRNMELGHAAHTIKGAAQLLGARALAQRAGAVENAVRDGGSLLGLAQSFIIELEHSLQDLAELAPVTVAGGRAELDAGERVKAQGLLAQAAPLLESADYEAGALLDQLAPLLEGGRHGQRFAALRTAYNDLDTGTAAALASAIAADLA